MNNIAQTPIVPATPGQTSIQERLLRREEVERMTGLRRSTIYEKAAQGKFPAPLKFGGSSLWRESAIQAWIAEVIRANEASAKEVAA